MTAENAADAASHDVGIEVNYREFSYSEDRDAHKEKVLSTIGRVHEVGGKLFLFSAMIREDELVHAKEILDYGSGLKEGLVRESVENVHNLMIKKYGKLLEKTHYSLENMKGKHGL